MHFMMSHVNWLAVLLAAVVNMVLGGLWYSPVLFAKAWMQENDLTEEAIRARGKEANRGYVIASAGSLVAAVILAVLSAHFPVDGAVHGALLGLLVGIAGPATAVAAHYAFEGRCFSMPLPQEGASTARESMATKTGSTPAGGSFT